MSSDKDSVRKLAAILFADIVGYTALMQKGEGKAMSILNRFQEVTKSYVKKHKGEIIKTYGDGSLILFDSTVDAVQCALDMQLSFRESPQVPLRIGIHVGEVIKKDNDIFGNGVNIASRVESMGIAGSVLMTANAHQKIKNQESFHTQSLGDYVLKNVTDPMEVFVLTNEGLSVPTAKDIGGKVKRSRSKFHMVLAIVSAIFIGVAGWSVIQTMGSAKEITIAVEENSIAVLPLNNLNGKNENVGYFADGITQEIIDQLAQISAIKVSAFTIASYYNDQGLSPENIAKELNVNYLISGTSRLLDDDQRVRISITLFNPYTKESLWSQTFDKDMNDAATIQMAIAKEVASTLDISLTPKTQASLEKANTSSGEAFRLFLHAKSEVDQLTEESLKRSQELLIKAIELDPDYAQAYTLLAWSYNLSGDPTIVPNTISTTETVKLVDPLIEKSINLDPESSDIYLIRGSINLYFKNKIRDAQKDVEKALKINSWPRIPTNLCICVVVSTYVAMGNLESARQMVSLAKQVDPGNVLIYWDRANITMQEGNYADAQKLYGQAVDKIDIPYFNTYLGMSIYHGGNYEKALEYLEKALDHTEGLPSAMNITYLSNTHYKLGILGQSDQFLKELIERDANGEHNINQFIAMVYASRNDIDQALKYLEIAASKTESGFAVNLGIDPIFKVLYEEPRFIEIRRGMQYYD